MLIFVLDGTEERLIYNMVAEARTPDEVDFCDNIDAARARVIRRPYDLILLSRAEGKTSVYDIAHEIKHGHLVGKSEIVFVEDHPTVSERFRSVLRGRKLHNYKFNQLNELGSIIKQMR